MPEQIHALAQHLADAEQVLLASLFGSQAEGTAGPRSDSDLGLLVRSPSLELWPVALRDWNPSGNGSGRCGLPGPGAGETGLRGYRSEASSG